MLTEDVKNINKIEKLTNLKMKQHQQSILPTYSTIRALQKRPKDQQFKEIDNWHIESYSFKDVQSLQILISPVPDSQYKTRINSLLIMRKQQIKAQKHKLLVPITYQNYYELKSKLQKSGKDKNNNEIKNKENFSDTLKSLITRFQPTKSFIGWIQQSNKNNDQTAIQKVLTQQCQQLLSSQPNSEIFQIKRMKSNDFNQNQEFCLGSQKQNVKKKK